MGEGRDGGEIPALNQVGNPEQTGELPSMATRRSRTRITPTQARRARRQRRARRRRIYAYAGGTAVGIIALLLIASLVLPGLPLDVWVSGAVGGSDGPGQRIEDQGRDHISVGEDHLAYNSVPGTSGWHYNVPIAPKRHGIYEVEIEDEYLIHNLEHAYVNVHYDCPDGCPELLAQLTPMVEDWIERGGKLLMSPYSGMDSRIALTAWNYIDKFDEFDEQRIRDFVTAHEGSRNAPEWNALR